jgi:hypothetical protein
LSLTKFLLINIVIWTLLFKEHIRIWPIAGKYVSHAVKEIRETAGVIFISFKKEKEEEVRET